MKHIKDFESFLNEAIDKSKSMLHFVTQEMSSGMLASWTDITDYKSLDKIKGEMAAELQKNDMEYSLDNVKKLLKELGYMIAK